MTDLAAEPTERRLLAIRLAIGLAQGLALYGLWTLRDITPDVVEKSLALAILLGPVVALGGLGALSRRTLTWWLAAATAALLGLGAYDGYLGDGSGRAGDTILPEPPLLIFAAAALFVSHHLILAADAEGRWIAPYGRYFDDGWTNGVRLALGAAFVGAFWLVLHLGASLFEIIGLKFLEQLLRERWFGWPATSLGFAVAVHVTDVRSGLVQGARTLALNLLAWLLPIMALIAVAFVVALMFTGPAPLWQTGRASGLLMAAAATLVILINAAYQGGERPDHPPVAVKWAVRVASVVLAPMTIVAAYGLALRVGQHGLTPERVRALACLLVASVYAAGYLWAALARTTWMRRLERVNLVAAHLAVVVVVAVFSPLADPARLSVANQLDRLADGRVAPAAFDYDFLRFQAGRWGRDAIERLRGDPRPLVREGAAAALAKKTPYEPITKSEPLRRATLSPIGDALPASFLRQAWAAEEDPARHCEVGCAALASDLDGDGRPEVVVFRSFGTTLYAERQGRWRATGQLAGRLCEEDLHALLTRGRDFVTVRPATGSVIELGGRALAFSPDPGCGAAERPRAAPP